VPSEKWDGCFPGSCLCCGDDVNFPVDADGLCGDGDEGTCAGCGRVYTFSVDDSVGEGDGPSGGNLREIEDGDERPKCSCPDEEFTR